MERKNIYTLAALAVLTITTAFFSNYSDVIRYVALIILLLSAIKFLLVAFQFMELKKANALWKTLIILILILFVATISAVILH